MDCADGEARLVVVMQVDGVTKEAGGQSLRVEVQCLCYWLRRTTQGAVAERAVAPLLRYILVADLPPLRRGNRAVKDRQVILGRGSGLTLSVVLFVLVHN